MSIPSSMYMFLSPLGMYLMFGQSVKLMMKGKTDVNLVDRVPATGVTVPARCADEVAE